MTERLAGRGVRVLAPAKINLFLHVGERRADGFHALESLAVFAETCDRLEFSSSGEVTLQITGPFAQTLVRDANNLVLKAARALQSVSRLPAAGVRGTAISLEKNLPVAAGLGGGSADAAATLRALNVLWSLDLAEADLMDIATGLGSDVPACLLSRPCWMEGRGERVAEANAVPPLPLILVNPGIAVPTAEVFVALNVRSGVNSMKPPPAPIQNVWDLVAYLDEASNDLEAPACRIAPIIENVLDALDREPGCVLTQMSGSGATCFGLFEQDQFARGAAERIAQDHPDWWVRLTRIAAPGIGTPAAG